MALVPFPLTTSKGYCWVDPVNLGCNPAIPVDPLRATPLAAPLRRYASSSPSYKGMFPGAQPYHADS